jgi:hypothetical protein
MICELFQFCLLIIQKENGALKALKQLRDSSNSQDFSDAIKILFLLFKCDDSPKTIWTNALTPNVIDLSTTNNKDEDFFSCMVLIVGFDGNKKTFAQGVTRL